MRPFECRSLCLTPPLPLSPPLLPPCACQVREESGITSVADVGQLLEAAPKPLVDALRQGAVVRHSATLLGATLGDRLRVNAKWAERGLYAGSGGGQPPLVGALQWRTARYRLAARVALLRLAAWLSSAVHAAAAYLLPWAPE